MTVGRIARRAKRDRQLSEALQTIRNPAPGVELVSHGWKVRCQVCERQTHAKWHECAQGEINPVALIQFIERQPCSPGLGPAVINYILAVAGIDQAAMRVMLESERAADAVDPHAASSGTPSTRD